MSEEQVKEVKSLIRQALKILENVDGVVEKPKAKKKAKIPSKTGVSFKAITTDDKQFGLLGVEVIKVFTVKSGNRKDGTEWTKQSLIIRDGYNEERELVAWGDHVEVFEPIFPDDIIDISIITKVTEYMDKHQYVIGEKTVIEKRG